MKPERRAEVTRVLTRVAAWAADRPDVVAVGLAGSWARDAARMSSDIDLVVLTTEQESYVSTGAWRDEVVPSAEPIRSQLWGVLREERVRLASGLEVEFGFVPPSWASIEPVDAGTARVVKDGFRAIYDPHGHLAALRSGVQASQAGPA